MKKETYTMPEIEVLRFESEDIIVTSNGTGIEPYLDDNGEIID